MFAHDNDVSNLFVGKEIKQGEVFYHEGTKGNATGNHCHIECGKGIFTDNGWHKNSNGYWSINNGKRPEECLWIDENIKVLDKLVTTNLEKLVLSNNKLLDLNHIFTEKIPATTIYPEYILMLTNPHKKNKSHGTSFP